MTAAFQIINSNLFILEICIENPHIFTNLNCKIMVGFFSKIWLMCSPNSLYHVASSGRQTWNIFPRGRYVARPNCPFHSNDHNGIHLCIQDVQQRFSFSSTTTSRCILRPINDLNSELVSEMLM